MWKMKIKQKLALSLGDLIKAVYQVWGPGQAGKMLQLAMRTRLVTVQKEAHFPFSSAIRIPALPAALHCGFALNYADTARN